ncbi:MAG: hypothetical protein AAGJ18_06605 [Bacteroidota bacterium]
MRIILLSLLLYGLYLPTAPCDKIIGTWLTEDGEVITFSRNDQTYQGRLSQLPEGDECPECIGKIVFSNLKNENCQLEGFYVDVESEKQYPAEITFEKDVRMRVKVGSWWYSETVYLIKINE